MNEMSDGRYPLHFAADYGQTDVLIYLLSKGANVNVRIRAFSICHSFTIIVTDHLIHNAITFVGHTLHYSVNDSFICSSLLPYQSRLLTNMESLLC